MVQHGVELLEADRLSRVADRLVGRDVDLDLDSIGPGRKRGEGHRGNVAALSRAVTGIHEHRQVGHRLSGGMTERSSVLRA